LERPIERSFARSTRSTAEPSPSTRTSSRSAVWFDSDRLTRPHELQERPTRPGRDRIPYLALQVSSRILKPWKVAYDTVFHASWQSAVASELVLAHQSPGGSPLSGSFGSHLGS